MKHFLFILFILNFVIVEAQNGETDSLANLDKTYILDSYWKAQSVKKFETDGYPSFLSIKNGIVTLFSKSRDKTFAYESTIIKFEVSKKNMNEKMSFVGEKHYVNPTRPSFEITEEDNGKVTVHLFQTLGGYDSYFIGHVASEEEVDALANYLKLN